METESRKKWISVDKYKVSLVRAYEILPFIWPCLKSHFYAKKKSHFDGNVWSYNEIVIFLGMWVEMKCDNFIIHIHDCSSSKKPLHRKHIPDLFHIIALSHLQLIMLFCFFFLFFFILYSNLKYPVRQPLDAVLLYGGIFHEHRWFPLLASDWYFGDLLSTRLWCCGRKGPVCQEGSSCTVQFWCQRWSGVTPTAAWKPALFVRL